MKFSITFFFVLIIHYFVLFRITSTREKEMLPATIEKTKSVRVFFKKHKKSKSKNKNKVLKNFKFKDLAYRFKKSTDISSGYIKAGIDQYSLLDEVYLRVENNLQYPSFLKELKKTGIVKAKIYFNRNGEYLETSTKILGPQFLKVVVAKTLRKTFSTGLMSKNKQDNGTYIDCFFDFRLITNKYEEKKSELFSDFLYFRRSGHGGERGVDYLNNTLVGITNVFSLLRFLPKSKKQKQLIIRKVEEYKRDLAW